MNEQCPSCPIHESCPLRGVVAYCSGVIDVTPWIEAIKNGIMTVDEVATILSDLSDAVGKSVSRLHLHGEVLSISTEPVHVVSRLTAGPNCEGKKFPVNSWDQGGAWR